MHSHINYRLGAYDIIKFHEKQHWEKKFKNGSSKTLKMVSDLLFFYYYYIELRSCEGFCAFYPVLIYNFKNY